MTRLNQSWCLCLGILVWLYVCMFVCMYVWLYVCMYICILYMNVRVYSCHVLSYLILFLIKIPIFSQHSITKWLKQTPAHTHTHTLLQGKALFLSYTELTNERILTPYIIYSNDFQKKVYVKLRQPYVTEPGYNYCSTAVVPTRKQKFYFVLHMTRNCSRKTGGTT